MLIGLTSLAMSTIVLEALPGKLDIKRHSPSIFYLSNSRCFVSTGKHHKIAKKDANKKGGGVYPVYSEINLPLILYVW